jgi:hypothetical protein
VVQDYLAWNQTMEVLLCVPHRSLSKPLVRTRFYSDIETER